MHEAWQAFDAYARIEPRLRPLWDLCLRVERPAWTRDDADDVFDEDPFELDAIADGKPDDGWCAEHFLLEHVKPKLVLLAGLHRPGDPHELHSREAYDALYDLLLNWALNRPCSCCAEHDDDHWHPGGDGAPAYP